MDISNVGWLALAATPAGQEAIKASVRLIESLLGRPFKIAGNIAADTLEWHQWLNRLRKLKLAREIIEKDRTAVRVIPPSFFLTYLDAAGNVDDETLDELWARLLASAVADDSAQQLGFIGVLRQFTPDEARILELLAGGRRYPALYLPDAKPKGILNLMSGVFSLIGDDARCVHPNSADRYLSNMERLGVVQIMQWDDDPEVYDPLRRHPEVIRVVTERGKTTEETSPAVISLTGFGRDFSRACMKTTT